MDLRLSGQRALVSASTAGIGLAIATSLAREGAEVIVNGRSSQTVDGALERIRTAVPGARLAPLVADCSVADGPLMARREYPAVDILVNNLGTYEEASFFDTTDEQWLRIFEVNVMSGVRLSREYLPGMLERDAGRVIFIASEAALMPSREMPHYSMTKTAQLSVARSLADLTAGTKVTVNTVMPGSTQSPGVADLIAGLFPDLDPAAGETRFMKENRSTSLIERLLQPHEIGDFVAYVASPLASAINGSVLRIDGGLVRHVF